MKKRVLATLIAGVFFLLAGCQNQINKEFLNRLSDLQEFERTETSLSLTNLEIDNDSEIGILTPYIQSGLEAMAFQATIQKDQTDPDLMSLEIALQAAGQSSPLIDGVIQDAHLILDAEDYINLLLLTVMPTQDYIALQRLQIDYKNRFIIFENIKEEESTDDTLSVKNLLDTRKRFLDLDASHFTETDTKLSVTLGPNEIQTLFEPLLTEVELKNQLSNLDDMAITITVSKDEPLVSILLNLDQVEFGMFSKIGFDMTMTFSDEQASVNAPDPALVSSQEQLQLLLMPEYDDGFSETGYPAELFEEVLDTIKINRNDWNRSTGRDLLDAYRMLLTEEQYTELEKALDVPTLSPVLHTPSSYPVTEKAPSPSGLDQTRFDALIDSVTTYRDAQTKASAQKTLDQYHSILNESQYEQLEKALDIESLPE